MAIMTDGLLIPFMLAFGTIIHVYAVRIAVLAELPKGQIGWIVPTYLLTGYGIYFLSANPTPVLPRIRSAFRWTWVASTIVPVVLLGLASFIRFRAYGLTEERYLLFCVVIGGILLAGLATIRRPLDLRVLPLLGGLLALNASVGPFNAIDVSIRSQTARAKDILLSVPPERWAAMPDGGLNPEQKESLLSAIDYLRRNTSDNLEALATVWPPSLPKDRGALQTILFKREDPITILDFDNNDVIQVGSLTLLDNVYFRWNQKERAVKGGSPLYKLRAEGLFLVVEGEGTSARFDLSSLMTMDYAAQQGKKPMFNSIEGRKSILIVKRFERIVRDGITEPDDMRVSIVLY
jgi:hypothetical protein